MIARSISGGYQEDYYILGTAPPQEQLDNKYIMDIYIALNRTPNIDCSGRAGSTETIYKDPLRHSLPARGKYKAVRQQMVNLPSVSPEKASKCPTPKPQTLQ